MKSYCMFFQHEFPFVWLLAHVLSIRRELVQNNGEKIAFYKRN